MFEARDCNSVNPSPLCQLLLGQGFPFPDQFQTH